jgi:hypothetical protein
MLKALKFFLTRLLLSVLYRLIRAYIWTFRLKIKNEERWMSYLENGGTVLICTWHQQFFTASRENGIGGMNPHCSITTFVFGRAIVPDFLGKRCN